MDKDPIATFSTSPSFTTTPPFTATPPFNTVTADGATDDDIDVGPAGPDFLEEVEGSDYSTEDSVESEVELVGDDDEEEYGSDVHVRELRAKKRSFQRRKRRERLTADNEDIPAGEAGPDLGFVETEKGKVSHEGRLGGDEPNFASSDEDNFELDEDECCNDDEHEFVIRASLILYIVLTYQIEAKMSTSKSKTIEKNWEKLVDTRQEIDQRTNNIKTQQESGTDTRKERFEATTDLWKLKDKEVQVEDKLEKSGL
ncbi:hypothetical protein RDI58_000821 [Solanum bulbocastanum]|uniref:Uncharacterized protein n=1 Tax=Solanum bulbocastanum TaxID=147425 RepID=A0AAN8UCV2_SOLBU